MTIFWSLSSLQHIDQGFVRKMNDKSRDKLMNVKSPDKLMNVKPRDNFLEKTQIQANNTTIRIQEKTNLREKTQIGEDEFARVNDEEQESGKDTSHVHQVKKALGGPMLLFFCHNFVADRTVSFSSNYNEGTCFAFWEYFHANNSGGDIFFRHYRYLWAFPCQRKIISLSWPG